LSVYSILQTHKYGCAIKHIPNQEKIMSGEFIIAAVAVAAVGFFVYKKFFKKSDGTAPLTIKASDVPSVSASAIPEGTDGVFLVFSSMEIQPAEGERLVFNFDAKTINLLESVNQALIENETVETGSYEWIRLMVDTSVSYVTLNGGEEGIEIPSAAQTGLKLVSGFTVGEEGADFTIDFNLDKSLRWDANKRIFRMKPTLKLIDNLKPEEPEEEEPTA